ncbi:MAG: TIGR01777 family oxidoreductase [bacterium]
MKVALFGASGFIGMYLKRVLRTEGFDLTIILREGFQKKEADFCATYIDHHDIIINLTGAPLSRKWTEAYKKEIYDSRILTTRKIVDAIIQASNPPKTLINVSAVGIYKDGIKYTEETTEFAGNFLGTLCRNWEAEAWKAREKCRVVLFRMGLVLAKDGGALEKMAPIFRSGLGAKVGNGEQGVSWVHMDDLIKAFLFVMYHTGIEGVVNAVGAYPTDNYYFSETLGKMFGQPVYFTIPRFVLKLIYGEGAQLLTEGQKVLPAVLLRNGFVFDYPTLDKALVAIYRD